jgi:FkbM family methyltransferase
MMIKNIIALQFWSKFLQIIVRGIFIFTGKGGGKFAKLLPPNQNYLVNNYCKLYKFNVNTLYPIESAIWLSGIYEVTTTKFLRQVLREGDVFLDVGANCGAVTLVAASAIKNGKIYAFEPGNTIRSRLQANVDLNPSLKSVVKVVPFGLGLETGKLLYYEDENYRGNGALFDSLGMPVDVITLDEWVSLEKIDKIDAIKIDVEGMEYDVLLGGKLTLEKYHPLVYFETLPIFFTNKSYSIQTIYEFLASLGYKIVSPSKPHEAILFTGPYPTNSVAIHSSQVERLNLVM